MDTSEHEIRDLDWARTFSEISLRWMPQNTFDDQPTLVVAITWASVDPDVCGRLAFLCHYGLKQEPSALDEVVFIT